MVGQNLFRGLKRSFNWRVVVAAVCALLLSACSGEFDPEHRLFMTLVNESEDRQLFLVRGEATEQGTADRGFSRVSPESEREFVIGTVLDGDSLCLDDEGPLWIFVGPPGFRVQDEFDGPLTNLGEMVPDRELWMTLEPEQCFPERQFEIVFPG